MIKKFFGILLLLAVPILASCRELKVTQENGAGENLIIYYAPEEGNEGLLKAAKEFGSEILYIYKNINGIAVTVPNGKSVTEAERYYEKIKGVLSVQQDRKAQLD